MQACLQVTPSLHSLHSHQLPLCPLLLYSKIFMLFFWTSCYIVSTSPYIHPNALCPTLDMLWFFILITCHTFLHPAFFSLLTILHLHYCTKLHLYVAFVYQVLANFILNTNTFQMDWICHQLQQKSKQAWQLQTRTTRQSSKLISLWPAAATPPRWDDIRW